MQKCLKMKKHVQKNRLQFAIAIQKLAVKSKAIIHSQSAISSSHS